MNTKFALISVSFIVTLFCSAQNFIFKYDEAGNRISRDLETKNNAPKFAPQSMSSYDAILIENTINIYPNPTTGIINVDIEEVGKIDGIQAIIYNLQGQIITSVFLKDSKGQLDITDQPSGIYVLGINNNNQISTWKVIKE